MSLNPKELKRKSSKHHHNQYVTDIIGGKPKYATRHLAALDFLQSITMKSEYRIMESRLDGIFNSDILSIRTNPIDGNSILSGNDTNILLGREDLSNIAGGKKLDGRIAPLIVLPIQFRYRMLRFNEQSAVIKNWEESILRLDTTGLNRGTNTTSISQSPTIQQSSTNSTGVPNSSNNTQYQQEGLLNSRAFFSRAHGYPICLMSIIGYAPEVEKARMEKRAEYILGANTYKIPQRDWRGISYRHCFQQNSKEEATESTEIPSTSIDYVYDPNVLDDPDMIQGKHRYVMRGDAFTGPVISSVILYVNEKDLKDDLNQKFREKHPQLPQSLTLSKIRKLKKNALLGCSVRGTEISTIAIAFISFELLCLKGLVTKANRRLSMAVCLLLAVKFNEPLERKRIDAVLDFCDQQLAIPKKEIFEAEFGAFVHLNFSLHYPLDHVYLMCSRLLKQV